MLAASTGRNTTKRRSVCESCGEIVGRMARCLGKFHCSQIESNPEHELYEGRRRCRLKINTSCYQWTRQRESAREEVYDHSNDYVL